MPIRLGGVPILRDLLGDIPYKMRNVEVEVHWVGFSMLYAIVASGQLDGYGETGYFPFLMGFGSPLKSNIRHQVICLTHKHTGVGNPIWQVTY